LIPTIATDTFIVCHTPTPTVEAQITETVGLSVRSPIIAVPQVIATRTRGPMVERTRTTVIAGTPTLSSDETIPMFGAMMEMQGSVPAMMRVQGTCTTSYKVRFGYSTAAAQETKTVVYPNTQIVTSLAVETAVATNVDYETAFYTAQTIPIEVPFTSSLGVFTTQFDAQPTQTLHITEMPAPTVIEYTAEPFPVTEVGAYTTTWSFEDVVYQTAVLPATETIAMTEVYPVTRVSEPTTLGAQPVETVLVTETLIPVSMTIPATVGPFTTPEPVTVTQASTITPFVTIIAQPETSTTFESATPTIYSTINVFPTVVQITVTASHTMEPILTTALPQVTILPEITALPIATTSVQTAHVTATSTQVIAHTFVSTQTMQAVPTASLMDRKPRAAVASLLKRESFTERSVPLLPLTQRKFREALMTSLNQTKEVITPVRTVSKPKKASIASSFTLSGGQYRLTKAGDAATGSKACAAMGTQWSVASILNDAEHTAVSQHIAKPVFYGAWKGDTYNGACLMLYPGGATTLPVDGCNGSYQTLCKAMA